MIIRWLIFISCTFSGCFAFTQSLDIHNRSDYWEEEGTLKAKWEYYYDVWAEREILHGHYSQWSKQNVMQLDCYYKEGKMDSLRKMWRPDGSLFESSYWKNGVKEGVTRYYDKNERLLREENYRDGRLNGLTYVYWKNGQLKSLTQFLDNRVHGHASTYDSKGKIQKNEAFEFGKKKVDDENEKKSNLRIEKKNNQQAKKLAKPVKNIETPEPKTK